MFLSNNKNLNDFVKSNSIFSYDKLIELINYKKIDIDTFVSVAESINEHKTVNSAHFTSQKIIDLIMNEIPNFKNKKHVRVLEPSVGAGAFIPKLINKYKDKLCLSINDIDKKQIELSLEVFNLFRENYNEIQSSILDFMEFKNNIKFDLIIGNPPFEKKGNQHLFISFLKKALDLSSCVSFIVPKTFLSSPEYKIERDGVKKYKIKSIIDFGELAFANVKVETINLVITKEKVDMVHIVSLPQKLNIFKRQSYIFDDRFPIWLIYRNIFFDKYIKKMKLNVFKVFRDRQITNKMLNNKSGIRILRSRNIGPNRIINIRKYDKYINSEIKLSIHKFLNKPNIVMFPNMSYYPRACFLPKNSLANGSIALLTSNESLTQNDLLFYSTNDFRKYFQIVMNFSTRTININSCTAFFIGIKK